MGLGRKEVAEEEAKRSTKWATQKKTS